MVAACPLPLVARTVTGKRPVTAGVPEMTPDPLKVTPAGRDPDATVKVAGPFPPIVRSVTR